MREKKYGLRQITTAAMFAAMAYVVALICHFVMPPLVEMPPLKLDLKDAVIAIAGMMLGPIPAAAISLIVSLLEMLTISSTGPIGMLMNVLSTCSFVCTASFIYKKKRTKGGAVVGLAAGAAAMVLAMLLWNYIVTPFYQGVPREAVAALLLPVFLPFNAVKAGLNMAITLLLYKPLVSVIRKIRPEPVSDASGAAGPHKISIGVYILGGALLVTSVLFALALAKVI